MRYTLAVCLLVAVAAVLVPDSSFASLRERVLRRRQSEEAGAPEVATPASAQVPQASSTQQPPRLYPDLPREPNQFTPPFSGHHYPPNHGPTPFIPFGISMPTNRLNNDPMQPWPPQQMPRPKSPAERAQSLAFTSGLGRRLLAMVGIESPSNETQVEGSTQQRLNPDQTLRALQNATILQQLNRGVQSIYGSVSKIYNSTVQEQLNLLQERFAKETANSTNPWQQRMAQQVPQFFKSVAAKVGEAQDNLNRAWRQLSQANNGSIATDRPSTMPNSQQQQGPPHRNFFSSFDQFMGNTPNDDGTHQQGNFFSQIGRTLGINDGPNNPAQRDLTSQLVDLWHNQVQPQIGNIRGQIMNVWRDLTATGVYTPEPVFRSRSNPNNLGSAPSETALPEVVEDVLKDVNVNNPEYTLIESQDNQQAPGAKPPVSSHIQNRLIAMQRDLNMLWGGLTKSLQNAINNVQTAMNPRTQTGGPMDSSASNANKQEADPNENKIEGTIKDLSKLQREADTVYDVVQQQQDNQRQGLGDRFKNFFNNLDFIDIDRVNSQVSRFGSAVGDMWNQLPRRWDDFMQNSRFRDQPNNGPGANGRLTASSTTQNPEPAAAQAN